ncbi:MAG: response regulator transcription factor [Verrucomicrobia bacterium]|nr:response regulator transcription factor [Verrucomicrobiota bacterium]
MMPQEVRIAVVEDDAEVRRQIVVELHSRSGWNVVAECTAPGQAERQLPKARPDLVLLDIGLADGTSGLDLIAPLKTAIPGVVIVMLTVDGRPSALARAIRLGACGYLLKPDVAGLADAIQEVLDGGGPVMSPSVARHLWNLARTDLSGSRPSDHGLTAREWEILRQAAAGKQQGEIALALGISVNTVKIHRRRIYDKLGVDSVMTALLRLRGGDGLLGQ